MLYNCHSMLLNLLYLLSVLDCLSFKSKLVSVHYSHRSMLPILPLLLNLVQFHKLLLFIMSFQLCFLSVYSCCIHVGFWFRYMYLLRKRVIFQNEIDKFHLLSLSTGTHENSYKIMMVIESSMMKWGLIHVWSGADI